METKFKEGKTYDNRFVLCYLLTHCMNGTSPIQTPVLILTSLENKRPCILVTLLVLQECHKERVQKYRRTVDRTCVHVFINLRSTNTPFRPVPLIRLPPHTPLSHPLPPLRRRRIFLCCYCCCRCVKERECRSTVRLTELAITSLTLGVQILLSDECCPRFTMMASSLLLCCLLYTSPSPRDSLRSRMPSSA